MKIRTKIIAQGRVQGVAFRNYTQLTAHELGVSGWVRNLPNGDVEGCFEGEDDAVNQLVAWCRRGPSAARVDNLIVRNEEFSDEFTGFEIRY